MLSIFMVSSFRFSSIQSWKGSFSEAKQLHDLHKGVIENCTYRTPQISILFEKGYGSFMFSRIEEDFCCICRERMQLKDIIIVHPCSHYLHDDCQKIWLQHVPHLKCLVCHSSIRTLMELKTEKERIQLPWTLNDVYRQKLLNELLRLVQRLPTFDSKMQKSIPLVLQFIIFCFQQIDSDAEKATIQLQRLIQKLPSEILNKWIDQLSYILVEINPSSSFFSDYFFKKSVFSYLLGNRTHAFINDFFIRSYACPSLYPFLEQLSLKQKDLLELKSYTETFKAATKLNPFKLIVYLKSINKEEYVILKKHTKGHGPISKRIQRTITCIDTTSKSSTLFCCIIFSAVIALGAIFLIIRSKAITRDLKILPF